MARFFFNFVSEESLQVMVPHGATPATVPGVVVLIGLSKAHPPRTLPYALPCVDLTRHFFPVGLEKCTGTPQSGEGCLLADALADLQTE